MGKRGPTTTGLARTGGKQQCSRWGNGGQPQLNVCEYQSAPSVADGETGANHNSRISFVSTVVV